MKVTIGCKQNSIPYSSIQSYLSPEKTNVSGLLSEIYCHLNFPSLSFFIVRYECNLFRLVSFYEWNKHSVFVESCNFSKNRSIFIKFQLTLILHVVFCLLAQSLRISVYTV